MQINGSESGVVRLFHLDLPAEAVARFTEQAGTGEWPLQYALGATRLRPAFVDVVRIADLGEMPLSSYLAQAYEVTGEDFRAMRPRIDALSGHVVVLPSQAFDHTGQELTIAAPLRWIGSFGEEQARARGPAPQSAAARVQSGTGGAPTVRPPRSPLLRVIVIAIALVVLGVAAVAVWLAG
ncbi:hypothetical protein Salmuc_04120 [Salipiger mucosus DSM 16094]|uniref:Aspartate carbamoyltransferase catalytic subunit n=2 Tax=Salipiger mucosus TaxID=263378 RepID=S9RF35_9RHOB|nr:hypothetical protein Salmuc_04120 [Salipiger mucosus DSM 16094]